MDKKKKKQRFVRILIGYSVTGSTTIEAPTKTISVENTTLEEVYKKIIEAINGRNKK